MHNYKPNPENDIEHNGVLILYGLSHKETGRPAWAIPGGRFTASKREAVRVADLIYKMGRNNNDN